MYWKTGAASSVDGHICAVLDKIIVGGIAENWNWSVANYDRCSWICHSFQKTLQGEVGASGIVACDIKLKLGYQKFLINSENEWLHEIREDIIEKETGDWSWTVSEFCGRLKLGEKDLKNLNSSELVNR